MSSAREIAPSLQEGDDKDVDEDEIHPGKKLSLRLLYFTSSSLEYVVPFVVVVGSSLTLSRDDSRFLLSERIRVSRVPYVEFFSVSLQIPYWVRAFFSVADGRRRGKIMRQGKQLPKDRQRVAIKEREAAVGKKPPFFGICS